VRFEGADRFGVELHPDFGSDFVYVGMDPSPDARPREGIDEWGSVWENIGVSKLGQVKDFPLKQWSDWETLNIPDVSESHRWQAVQGARQQAGDKFLMARGISLYERVHFLRGLENTWIDIYAEPQRLTKLIDVLVEMNIEAIRHYQAQDCDGYMWCDDWGLQDRLMISPEKWREIWKPAYRRVYGAAHDAGMLTFLHSCGNIMSILDDLIEAGLDVIQMDQQQNMGIAELGQRFAGRITFWCPVDIQGTLVRGTEPEIRQYCRDLVKHLGCPGGGFLARWYSDSEGAGHRPEAVQAMCDEFVKLAPTVNDVNGNP
jgi:hypothetical protein